MTCPRCGSKAFSDGWGGWFCAKWCGWTDGPVDACLRIVKHRGRSAPRPGMRDQRPWTDADRSFLRANAAVLSHADIGAVLGRTAAAVKDEYCRLFAGQRKPYRRQAVRSG